MVDMFDPVIEANKPAIDLFGHGFIVLTIRILVQFLDIPKPSGSQSRILWRGHQLWLHDQVHTQRLASVVVVRRACELNAPTASETIPIPTGLIPVAHAAAVNSVGNELGVSGTHLGLGRIKALGPELLQSLCPVIQVLFQDSEIATLMATLADKGSLAQWRGNVKALESLIEGIYPLWANVQLGQLFTIDH